MGNLSPFFIWAGGKTRLLKHYRKYLFSDANPRHYVEPFFGGGAVFCELVNTQRCDSALINDSNLELMSVYRALRNQPEKFLAELESFSRPYLDLSHKEKRKEFYYRMRKEYWAHTEGEVTTAALLYFLMRTSFNGIWQTCEDAKGKFATPAGLLNQKKLYDAELLLRWSEQLQKVAISSVDFAQLDIPHGSLIYCDPPYRGSFTTYGRPFDDQEQLRLIDWCDTKAKLGSVVLLSNRDIGDGFFDDALPPYCEVLNIDVTYTAGRRRQTSGGFEAKKAKEILAIFRPS